MLTNLLHNDRFIHSIKTAFAVLIGFAITKSIHLPVDQWLIITILVVMCAQMNVGSMVQKSYMRFLGTLTGSLIAIATLAIFNNNPLAIAIVITLSTILFTYIATSPRSFNDSGTLGAVTVTIILISQDPTIITAAGRFLEISVGILIAALVSQFILPIHARRNLRNNQAQTIRQLRAYYETALLTDHAEENMKNLTSIDEKVVKALIAQRKLATDASREPFSKAYRLKHFNESLWCEKEILRSITFMYHANQASPNMRKLFSTMRAINEFNESVCDTLGKIAESLQKKSSRTIPLPKFRELRESIEAAIKILSEGDIIYAHGFIFSAGILVARIEYLINLVTEMNRI